MRNAVINLPQRGEQYEIDVFNRKVRVAGITSIKDLLSALLEEWHSDPELAKYPIALGVNDDGDIYPKDGWCLVWISHGE